MSIQLLESEIRRFLVSEKPEVVSITGHWGIGKTFAWKHFLTDAQAQRQIGLKRYSYVSLFGVNSLEEFKYAIFENSVKTSAIGIEPNLETLRSNTAAASERLGRKALWFLQQVPLVRNNIGGLGPVWFLSISDTTVCVDDIERRGGNLAARDVMGLVSMLKEQRRCKVALVWNDDAEEKEKEEFRMYHEKVVDTSLKFDPSPRESVGIALHQDTKAVGMLAADCISLGINNIRLIKRIERSVRDIENKVSAFDENVLKQAVHTLTLLGWSIYGGAVAPSLEFLQKKRGAEQLGTKTNEPVSEKEAAWNAVLDAYAFTGFDDFDLVLLDGIQNGFFDPVRVGKSASELSKRAILRKLDSSFFDAWEMYHDSFDNNQGEVLDTMYSSFLKTAQTINPINLNSTVVLFKRLGRPAPSHVLELETKLTSGAKAPTKSQPKPQC